MITRKFKQNEILRIPAFCSICHGISITIYDKNGLVKEQIKDCDHDDAIFVGPKITWEAKNLERFRELTN